MNLHHQWLRMNLEFLLIVFIIHIFCFEPFVVIFADDTYKNIKNSVIIFKEFILFFIITNDNRI